MDLDFLGRLAAALAEQFGRNCEVVVHDLRSADTEHTIAIIENGHVSARHAGDGASRAALEAIARRDDPLLQDRCGYLTKTRDGRILKSSTVYVRSAEGRVEAMLSVNYDITDLLMAERAVDALLNHKKQDDAPKNIPRSVNELLDDLIEQSVAQVGKPVALMTKDDKIEAIRFLSDAGAFLVTRSGDRVSQYFGISKYTLYSYIDAKKNEKETGKADE